MADTTSSNSKQKADVWSAGSRTGVAGEASTFDSSTYKLEGMMYPEDLMAVNNQYGGNYVIFYLNVHEDSKVIKDSGNDNVVPQEKVLVRQAGNVADADISKGAMVAMGGIAGAGVAQGAGAAQKVSGFFGAEPNSTVATTANVMVGGAAGAGVAAYAGASKKYKRMTTAIALHVPTELSIKYGIDWQTEDMAGSLAMASTLENMGPVLAAAGVAGGAAAVLLKSKIAGAVVGAGTGLAVNAFTGGMGKAAEALGGYGTGLALSTPGVGPLLSKTAGVAANPKKEQLFRSVDFRTFSFSYQFFPRNSKEARNALNIIQQFKFHMHPEFKDASQFLYIMPSEFDVFYYKDGKENMNLHRHTSCVLTDLNVSYSPQGVFATFPDGMPTQINVQMTFKELALLSKESVKDGF